MRTETLYFKFHFPGYLHYFRRENITHLAKKEIVHLRMTVPWRDNHYIVTGYDVEKQQGDREKIFVSITPFLIFV